MKLAEYIKGRSKDHQNVIRRKLLTFDFQVSEVIMLPQTSDMFELLASSVDYNININPRRKHPTFVMVKSVGGNWCKANCMGKWGKLNHPMVWAFENEIDAMLFKLTWQISN